MSNKFNNLPYRVMINRGWLITKWLIERVDRKKFNKNSDISKGKVGMFYYRKVLFYCLYSSIAVLALLFQPAAAGFTDSFYVVRGGE